MIDIEARTFARQIISRILADGLHPQDVELNWPRSDDRVVRSIRFWLWTLYDDDTSEVVHFGACSDEHRILRNAEAFLSTLDVFVPRDTGVLANLRHLLSAGVEWRGCELPWHRRWPFPPDTPDIFL